MSITPSLSPLSSDQFGPPEAAHLLRRAGFGPTPAKVDELVALGPDAAVAAMVDVQAVERGDIKSQFDLDPDVRRPLTDDEKELRRKAREEDDQDARSELEMLRNEQNRADRRMMIELRNAWVQWMTQTPQPFEERMTLFWHGHFATRARDVRDAYLMAQQNCFLRDHAVDSFAVLAAGIIHDPAMLKFLNNDRNNRKRPNENLARELMELFTLGEGNYTEQDIRQGARALTGYFVDDNDFRFRKYAHDPDEKTLFSRKGDFDGDDFVRILLAQPACSQFIAFKLYRHFVADIPEDPKLAPAAAKQVIVTLAEQLRADDYRLKPMLTRLMRSEHFYDPGVVGQQIKSPALVAVGTARMLGTPLRRPLRVCQAMAMAGQDLFDPPNVAGWDGGRSWINTSTLFVRQNLCAYLIAGEGKDKDAYDLTPVREALGDASGPDAVRVLANWLVGHHLPDERRQPLNDFVKHTGSLDDDRVLKGLLLLITAMPEYQLT